MPLSTSRFGINKMQDKIMLRFSKDIFAFTALAVALLAPVLGANFPDVLPTDPATQGYTVDNDVLPLKESARLPRNSSFKKNFRIDDRYRLANLAADAQVDHFLDMAPPIVLIDSFTGEVKNTQYQGDLQCFNGGRVAISTRQTRQSSGSFLYGNFGETLAAWDEPLPPGMKLNRLSCHLVERSKSYGRRNDGIPSTSLMLRQEHGFLMVTASDNLPADTAHVDPGVQALMQHPFMRTMQLSGIAEEWILKKANGEEVPIEKNPREAADIQYLPYVDAYFMRIRSRAFIPKEMQASPMFARLLYPDGRTVRFGIPDVIWDACWKEEIGCDSFYTKVGMVWSVKYVRINRRGDTLYKGILKEGLYLDQPNKKLLKRLPIKDLGSSPLDGCTLESRIEINQKRPTFLSTQYTVNLCEGMKHD